MTGEQAKLVAENRRLQLQVEDLQSKKKKKKVALDPNTVFANVEVIKRSLEEAEQMRVREEMQKAKTAEKKANAKAKVPLAEAEASRTSLLLQRTQMEEYMFEWEL